ncbi:Hsp20 family protein [Methylobacillus sp. Pita2]|uniref:Hsp20 family protein n=1 Tax=Methylobacillus sp. Pita2 TaxID=3383245 RepID=UPI0038B46649
MRTFDFSPLYRSAIGFDRLAQLIAEAQRSENDISYPPYNIELLSDDQYKIVMAVAGFDESELHIETEQQKLKVQGRHARDAEAKSRNYLHQGIAARDFEHTFQLADHVKVTNASLDKGLLTIELVREVPEALKPRKIDIRVESNPKLLEERQAA